MTAPIFVISGVPGIGKTSVSTALMGRFPLGIHIPVDDIRAWVVSGYADPTRPWTEETERQFALARMEAAVMARRYSEAGFAVAIDDVIWPAEVDRYITPRTGDRPLHRVLLHAPLDVILRRNTMRTNKSFDTSVLEETIRRLHANLDPRPERWPGWTVLDTSRMTLDATVEAILASEKSD
jgi:tRNA uridine 5-carbamoylmethylation protein Kti12